MVATRATWAGSKLRRLLLFFGIMPDILLVILAVIFVLGIAINIHEFGHFMVAKLLGIRVEAYSFFGLGPRIWGFKVGHTDYRISAIPLGAYVKLYGDEATAPLEGGSSEKDLDTFLDERNIGAAEKGKGAASHVVPNSELVRAAAALAEVSRHAWRAVHEHSSGSRDPIWGGDDLWNSVYAGSDRRRCKCERCG